MSSPMDAAGYACLFAGHSRAAALRALYAWANAIDELVSTGRTRAHEAAHHKLQWWQEELQRLNGGQPVHPLTKELHRVAPEPGLWSELPQRLELAALELGGVAPDDQAAAARWDWRRHGAVQWTALRLLAPAATAPEAATTARLRRLAEQLGAALGRVDACTAPLESARQGRVGLPLEALEKHGIAVHDLPEALGAPQHSAALKDVVNAQLALAAEALAEARRVWAELPMPLRTDLRHTAVRRALVTLALQRLQREPLLSSPARLLPPWRTLVSAWRAARKAHR